MQDGRSMLGVRGYRLRAWTHVLALLLARRALALDLSQQPFAVGTWTRPAGLHAVAQAPDGMLWLGGRDGLYRFDGQRFTEIEVSAEHEPLDVRRVVAAADGAVWAATGAGTLELRGPPERPELV